MALLVRQRKGPRPQAPRPIVPSVSWQASFQDSLILYSNRTGKSTRIRSKTRQIGQYLFGLTGFVQLSLELRFRKQVHVKIADDHKLTVIGLLPARHPDVLDHGH